MAVTGGGSPYVGAGGGASTVSVGDTYLNTWQVAIDYTGTNRIVVLYAENITGGASHEIAVTTGADESFISEAIEVFGALASGSLDVTANHSTTGAAFTSNPATITTASEYLIGVHQYVNTGAATLNPDAGWLRISGRGSAYTNDYIQDQIATATGAYQSSGIVSISGDVGWPVTSVMVAFKAIPDAVTYSAPIDGQVPALTASITATESFSASITASNPSLTASVAAEEIFSGTASGTLQACVSNGAFVDFFTMAEEIFSGTINVSIATLTSVIAAATEEFPATIAGTIPALTGALTAEESFPATIDGFLSPVSGTILADYGATGTAVITTGSWNGSGTTLTLVFDAGRVILASAV